MKIENDVITPGPHEGIRIAPTQFYIHMNKEVSKIKPRRYMRKLFYYFTLYFWFAVGLFVIMAFILIFTGCAGISFKAPTTQMLTRSIPFVAGYEIGKADPGLAQEFIHYTQTGRPDILTFFRSRERYLAYRLSDDPIRRKLINEMLNLVEVDLKFKAPDIQKKIIRELFGDFIAGLEAGIAK